MAEVFGESGVIKVELWIKCAARNSAVKYLSFKKCGNERKEEKKTIINRVRKRKDKTVIKMEESQYIWG